MFGKSKCPQDFLESLNYNFSEQLPCRSAEVKFFSVFLCQRCREFWREILVKFSALRFPGFGCATENFTKISRQKRCEKRKISRKCHSAGAQRWNFESQIATRRTVFWPATHESHWLLSFGVPSNMQRLKSQHLQDANFGRLIVTAIGPDTSGRSAGKDQYW